MSTKSVRVFGQGDLYYWFFEKSHVRDKALNDINASPPKDGWAGYGRF